MDFVSPAGLLHLSPCTIAVMFAVESVFGNMSMAVRFVKKVGQTEREKHSIVEVCHQKVGQT